MLTRFASAVVAAAIAFCGSTGAQAAGSKPAARTLPPIGIALPEAERDKIQSAATELRHRLAAIAHRADLADLIPDVEVYEKAVRFALLDEEFYSPKEGAIATTLLATANKRLDELEHGQHSWTDQDGQLVRGYRSKIDDSAQPYGLEIPQGLDLSHPVPLYVWLHGRGDKDTDLHFIRSRDGGRRGQVQPAGAIVMHAFGRQCIGFKSAGEIDVFEAIHSVQSRYKIDPDRVVLMGFSMGGAGAWHVGAHYADQFAAVHAGAGFVDVLRYQHLKPEDLPPSYEQTLWGVYDVPDYVRNLFNVTTVAYGGEIDPQRASSEIMAEAFKAEGHELVRIVGPKMPHKYDPASLAEIMRRMNDAVVAGRNRFPKKISLQTRTLRYNHMFWASATALTEHWKDSRLDAEVTDAGHIAVTTKNMDGFTLKSPWPTSTGDRPIEVSIDGTPISVPLADLIEGRGGFYRTDGKWRRLATVYPDQSLRKKPGLQGPIDDVFLEPFLVVTPSGICASPAVQKWVEAEIPHFHARWRQVFRGELRMKKDSEVTAEDIGKYHLILWGDEKSNRLIAKVIGKLPFKWTSKELSFAGKAYDAATHVPLAIYPSPLNAGKYVVLNSGPTFREASDRTNSLQNPKLPDWAIIDITTPPDGKTAGKVEAAGFFDEHWQVKPQAHEN